MPGEDLLLTVQRRMIGILTHNHLRQQTRSRPALLDGARWLARRLHRADTSVLGSCLFDHFHARRNVFQFLAEILANAPQCLVTTLAVLVALAQIVFNTLALEMLGEALAPTRDGVGVAAGRWRRGWF